MNKHSQNDEYLWEIVIWSTLLLLLYYQYCIVLYYQYLFFFISSRILGLVLWAVIIAQLMPLKMQIMSCAIVIYGK